MVWTKLLNFLVAFIIFFPIPNSPSNTGMYNPNSRIYWCTTDYICLHEYAHWLDQDMGWISKSEGFQTTMKIYMAGTIHGTNEDSEVIDLIGKNWQEIYAYFYANHDGNVPDEFEAFYPYRNTTTECLNLFDIRICQEVAN